MDLTGGLQPIRNCHMQFLMRLINRGLYKVPRSFEIIIIKPFKSLLRTFTSQSQSNPTSHGGAAEGRPPTVTIFYSALAPKGS